MLQLNYTNDSKPWHLCILGHQSPRTSHSMISLKATLRRSFPDGEKWHICSESLCCRKFWNFPFVDLIIFNTLSERSLQKKKKKKSDLFHTFCVCTESTFTQQDHKRRFSSLLPSHLTQV